MIIIFIKKDQGKVQKSEKWHGDINVQNCERSKATLSSMAKTCFDKDTF